MRNLVFILLLLPALVFAQQRKGVSTMKIKKKSTCPCLATLNGHYLDDTLSKADFNAGTRIELAGNCGDSAKVVGFIVAMGLNATFFEMISDSDHFPKTVLDSIAKIKLKSYLIIKSVQCRSAGGQFSFANGMALCIDPLRKPKATINENQICILASINGLWGDMSMKPAELISAGKLTLMGDYPDSAKIIGFQMQLGMNGRFTTLTSYNEYFTNEMISTLKKAPTGAYIVIKDIKCTLPHEGIRLVNGLAIRLL